MVVQFVGSQKKMHAITTRFGNVLGSNGSVVPIFRKQIEAGGPVKVTHPDITRYFMTIPEASALVIEAGTMGSDDEIFVFDMGEQIKIVDLANRMIRLAGHVPGEDMEIVFSGLRPGEKLFEELFSKNENMAATHHPKILKAMKTEIAYEFEEKVSDIINSALAGENGTVNQLVQQLVPELNRDGRGKMYVVSA